MNTNFKSTSKSCLQSYILPSLTGLRATLLPLGGRRGSLLESVALHWGRVCFFLLSLLLFSACSSDNDEQVQQPQPEKSYPLTIEVTENPMTGDGENSSNRAAITTTSTLDKFYLNYQYGSYYSESGDKQTITKSSETWTGGNWPTDAVSSNDEVNWYAYTDGVFHFTGGTPNRAYVTCASDEFSAGQKDFLVSTASGTYTGTSNGKLSFTFNHACAAVRFLVKKSANLGDHTLTVSSIVLKNVVKHGKYYYDTDSWTLINESASDITNYTLFSGSMTPTSSYTYLNGSENDSYLFLLPQTLTGWDGSTGTYVEIVWESNYGSHSSGTAKIPLAKTLNKGHRHDITIGIGTSALTTYSGY